MRALTLPLLVLLVLAALASGGPRPVRADDDPVVDSSIGREVHADLRAWYERKCEAPYPYRKAVTWLRADDAEQRLRGGEYLLAFFRQTLHDEQHGLAPAPDGYKLGGGPQDTAAEVRWIAARELAGLRVPGGGRELLEPALWLLHEDPRDATYGARALANVRGEEADRALQEILVSDESRHEILLVALEAAKARNLRGAEPAVLRLATHYAEKVRDAARTCLAAWGVTDVAPYAPAEGLRWVEGDLARLTSLLYESTTPNEGWCRVVVTEPPWQEGEEPYVHEAHGWLKARTDAEVRLVDWFGMPTIIEAAKTEVFEETPAERAAQVVADRKDWLERDAAGAGYDGQSDFAEEMGAMRFMRTAGRWEGSLPEALLAAWCLEGGDVDSASALLLPILDAWDDPGALFAYLREQLAVRLDGRMLDAFVQGRYADALPLARHLAQDAFADFVHHDRAVGLAEQLPRRMKEDFVTLDLPTPDAWEALCATLSREDRIRYLAQRIRLIRAEQMGIPGGISYADEQWRPKDPNDTARWTADRIVLVNPYTELWRMNLAANELPLLFDVVRSDDYIRAYDLPRFLPHWPMNLHRARWVAGSLVESVAQQDLLDPKILASGDAQAIEAHLAKARAWCEAEGAVTFGDRLERAVAESGDWEQAQGAAYQLNALDRAALGRAAAKRLATDGEHRKDLLMLAAHAGAAQAVPFARQALADGDAETRGWAALLLVKAGDAAKREGIDALLAVLAAEDLPALANGTVDALLAANDEAATKGLLALLPPDAPHPTTMLVVQRLFLAGHEEARDVVLRLLEEGGPAVHEALPWMSGDFEDVGGPRQAAWELGDWSDDVPRLGKRNATEEERAAWLESVRAWVRRAFERVKAGEDPGIERLVVAEPFVSWSGYGRWIRRL